MFEPLFHSPSRSLFSILQHSTSPPFFPLRTLPSSSASTQLSLSSPLNPPSPSPHPPSSLLTPSFLHPSTFTAAELSTPPIGHLLESARLSQTWIPARGGSCAVGDYAGVCGSTDFCLCSCAVWQFERSTALRGWVAIVVHFCPAALWHSCTLALLHFGTLALWHSCTSALLQSCTAALLHFITFGTATTLQPCT